MKLKLTALFAVLFLVGCASFNATVFNAENFAADSGKASLQTYKGIYDMQIQEAGTNVEQIAKLNKQRDQVYDSSRRLAASLRLTESLRLAYATNASTTNKLALQSALTAVGANQVNVSNTVQTLITQ